MQLRLYRSRKEKGLCVACGKAPPCEGLSRCQPCREIRNAISKRQKDNRPTGVCRSCLVRNVGEGKKTCLKCSESGKAKSKLQAQVIRLRVLALYGGKCVCCSDTRSKYLQLDHLHNDGHVERKKDPGTRGARFYKKLSKMPVREDLQILCANCHNAKRYGGCTEEEHPRGKLS